MRNPKPSIQVRIDAVQSARLARISAALGKSRQDVFRDAIEEFLTHVLPLQMGRQCRCLNRPTEKKTDTVPAVATVFEGIDVI